MNHQKRETNATLAEATRLARAGLSVIPIRTDGSKAPFLKEWKPYQRRIADADTLQQWFKSGNRNGLAVIAGAVSGNLEILDFDEPGLAKEWAGLVREQGGASLLKKLVIVRTPTGGHHVYFCCPEAAAGNQKLARRKGENGRPEVLIETRGEGGYALLPGSPADCHHLKKPYTLIQGELTKIPTIAPADRELLIQAARALNQYVEPTRTVSDSSESNCGRPGDEFNVKASWPEVLEKHGWNLLFKRGDVDYWQRPGKEGPGLSATTNFGGSNLLYVFSSNAQPFESDRAYSKFSAFSLLEHGGDYSAAAAALA